MSAQETNLTFALDGGIVTTALDEAVQLPNLVRSDNTRLSVLRGSVVAAPTPKLLGGPNVTRGCAGIVPAQHVDSSVVFNAAASSDAQRVAGTELTRLDSPLRPSGSQNGYRPTQIARAGAVSGALELSVPVLCLHQGLRVFASMRYQANGDVGLFVTALDAEGRVVIAPQLVQDLGPESIPTLFFDTIWYGLTSHGANGLRLWYALSDLTLHRRTLTLAGLDLTIGADVVHPLGANIGLPYWNAVVTGGNDNEAFLVFKTPSTGNSYLDKVDVVANTYTRATLPEPAGGMVSLSFFQGAQPYLALGYLRATGGTWVQTVWRADTFVELWRGTENIGVTGINETVVQFLVDDSGAEDVLFGISRLGTLDSIGSGTDDPPLVHFQLRAIESGTLHAETRRYWMRFADRGATLRLPGNEALPVFTLIRDYDYAKASKVGDPAYLADPSREVYTAARFGSGDLHISPVARFGVDTAKTTRSTIVIGGVTSVMDGARYVTPYLTETYEYADVLRGGIVRYVEVDFTPKQPRVVHDAGGVALIAAAQPASWDGREVVEAGPLHQPVIKGYGTGGTGDALEGTFLFRVMFFWRDAAGYGHRSSPSFAFEVTGTDVDPVKPRLYVPVPDSLRNGMSQDHVKVLLYQAGPITSDDPSVTPSSAFLSRADYKPTFDGVRWAFTEITAEPLSYLRAEQSLLYTTGQAGEELPAEAPPALWDGADVGARQWGIHGELRGRAIYTKKRVDGLAPEWSTSVLFVDMPAAAGDLVAVRELDGKPLLFGQNGAYTLDGEGINNLGEGDYGDPRCVASVGCTSRESVVRFPGGVLFASGRRMAMMQPGGGVRVFDEVDITGLTFVAAVVLPQAHEVVLSVYSNAGGYALVYNYVLDRWTKWPAWLRFSGLGLATPTRALAYASQLNQLLTIDVDVAGAASIVQETGRIAPAGPQGDCAIRELLVLGVYKPGYTLRVEVFQDYDVAASFDWTYSQQELADARDGTSKSRFTLRCALENTVSRAFRVRFTASTSNASVCEWMPIAVTVPLGVNAGELRRHVAAGMK